MNYWNNNLLIEIDEVDNQHMELFQKTYALHEAGSFNKDPKEIETFINFLEKYITEHFQYEEDLQKINKYPDYQNHKKQHDKFILSFKKLKQQYEQSGLKQEFILKLTTSVNKWLIEHINKSDKEFADYFKYKN